MKERINRLAKGIVDSELPILTFSPDQIEETIRINTTARRELFIGSGNGLNVKGLIYSSDIRVRIPGDNNAFGGLRNHVIYEIDTSFLAPGDEIRGCFYLVTNCGEREIPYVFHMDLASSGQVLGELRTAEDFLEAAKRDMDTALRLLEYQDFTEAPFMQDLHVRALYDGLKGHGSRQNFMEEFLIALGVKSPNRLMIESEYKSYENPSGHLEDFVTVRTEGWGYLYLEVTADGEFIHLPRKRATQADFVSGVLRMPFLILSERLHAGKNFGSISFTTARETVTIPVMASADRAAADPAARDYREGLARYLRLRLSFEGGLCEEALCLGQMQRELDRMLMISGDPLLPLLQAELDQIAGRQDKACLVLDGARDRVIAGRVERRELYCFYQYLQVKLQGSPEQKDALIRLLQKYACEEGCEGNRFVFYLMLLRMDEALCENPGSVFAGMERQFRDGCRSPFLYLECLKLLEARPELLRGMSRFAVQVLYFGAKRGMVGEELALRAAGEAAGVKLFSKLHLRLLAALYDRCQDVRILTAILAMLIRGDCRDCRYFPWFEKGVDAGISLTRLYEYYLYSLPEDYDRLLPREVLLYFSYGNELDTKSRTALYQNIVSFAGKDTDIYRGFEREIEQFSVEQLLAGRINRRLAAIYGQMLCKELIDRQLAAHLPEILRANRIVCRDTSMRYVVVRREEVMTEDAYPLRDGEAYVPVFSERDVILFQDGAGNRYQSVRCERTPAMEENDELMDRCLAVFPEHPMLLVGACYEAMEKEELTEADVLFLEQAEQRMRLHPLFLRKLLSAIVRYYRRAADGGAEGERGSGMTYLLSMDKDALTREERSGVCETLIRQDRYAEAYDMICRYGSEGISLNRLLKLCTKMVLKKLFDEDDRLLFLAYRVFEDGKSDSILLDYLCEHFNGTVDQMYRVLMQGLREHVETYDLEERLVAQMLFTGNTEKLDKVFDLYASRKKTGENIVKAYFTVKSVDYFLNDRPTEDKVFAYLEGAVNTSVEKDKVPDIYLLALTKYYSTLPELKEEQRELCKTVVDVLIEAGMIFSYFKALSRFILIPGNILDKEIIEYHGKKDVKPYLKLRILPGEEEYHFEDMRPIYKGIYIREKVLFEGEILEYQILEEQDGRQEIVKSGTISCGEVVTRAPGNRFACLNEMSLSLEVRNENALRTGMEEYLKKDAVVAALFTLQ